MIEETAKKIRELEIQGATNVALESLRALEESAPGMDLDGVREGIELLKSARPTEPMAHNVLDKLRQLDEPGAVGEEAGKWAERIVDAKEELTEIGARLIQDGHTVQTICHSSTVVDVILKARNDGKRIRAVNTETRPRYQGRTTAKELYKGGVPVRHYVDSAIYAAMKREKVDIALVGIDAIFTNGNVANKIGTGLLALAAKAQEVPFYACGLALKVDPGSLFAKGVPIEERDPREVWDYPVDVRNPAFEDVPAERLTGIVTELGVLTPETAYIQIKENYKL